MLTLIGIYNKQNTDTKKNETKISSNRNALILKIMDYFFSIRAIISGKKIDSPFIVGNG